MPIQSALQPHITRTLRVTVRFHGQPVTLESCIKLPCTASEQDILVALAASFSLYQNPIADPPGDQRTTSRSHALPKPASPQQWTLLRAVAEEAGYSVALLNELIRARHCDPRTLTKAEAHALIDDFRNGIIQAIGVLTY